MIDSDEITARALDFQDNWFVKRHIIQLLFFTHIVTLKVPKELICPKCGNKGYEFVIWSYDINDKFDCAIVLYDLEDYPIEIKKIISIECANCYQEFTGVDIEKMWKGELPEPNLILQRAYRKKFKRK